MTNGDQTSDVGQLNGGGKTETGKEHQGNILGTLKRARGQKGGKQNKLTGHRKKIFQMERGDALG